MQELFNPDFSRLEGERVALRLIGTFAGGCGALPFYWWEILSKPDGIPVGKISLRLGQNRHSYYNGNIGYEVDGPFRGHHYALAACQLLPRVARYHGMGKLYITCDHDNIPSRKTIEALGAALLEEVRPPRDYIYYHDDMALQCIYLWTPGEAPAKP